VPHIHTFGFADASALSQRLMHMPKQGNGGLGFDDGF
jgi:hypothetical protein